MIVRPAAPNSSMGLSTYCVLAPEMVNFTMLLLTVSSDPLRLTNCVSLDSVELLTSDPQVNHQLTTGHHRYLRPDTNTKFRILCWPASASAYSQHENIRKNGKLGSLFMIWVIKINFASKLKLCFLYQKIIMLTTLTWLAMSDGHSALVGFS